MSRVSDLLDLIQNANDFYLINPLRNVRSVYIQIDDLCELALKSWLQMDVSSRQEHLILALKSAGLINNRRRTDLALYFDDAIDEDALEQRLKLTSSDQKAKLQESLASHQPLSNWSEERGGGFKNFKDVVDEVKDATPSTGDPSSSELHKVLDRIQERRTNRNKFFHDQNQTGLTVDNDSCLDAFFDLYQLCDYLFGASYRDQLQAKVVVRAQIAVIKLKRQGAHVGGAINHYNKVLKERGNVILEYNGLAHEYCALHEDASRFLQRIQRHFEAEISDRQSRIREIGSMKKRTRSHQEEEVELSEEIDAFKNILSECFGSAL